MIPREVGGVAEKRYQRVVDEALKDALFELEVASDSLWAWKMSASQVGKHRELQRLEAKLYAITNAVYRMRSELKEIE